MNNLFNQSEVSQILDRIEKLTPKSNRQWGKMNVAQMLAHCNMSMVTAMGMNYIKQPLIGRIIGSLLRSVALGEKPFAKNSQPTKAISFPKIFGLR